MMEPALDGQAGRRVAHEHHFAVPQRLAPGEGVLIDLKVVLDPHVSLRRRRWHIVELVPIFIVPLFYVAPTVVRQIEPQEIRGAEVRSRVAMREVATVTGHPDHADFILGGDTRMTSELDRGRGPSQSKLKSRGATNPKFESG